MYDHILIPTDGSEGATRALEHAVAIADRFDATLHGLYVVETRTAYDNAIVDPEEVESTLRKEGEAALEALEERAAETGVTVETDIRTGSPPEEIETTARELGADLVVLGARGRSAFKERLLGSATERVLRAGDVPVLVAERSD